MTMRYSQSAPGFFPADIDYGKNLPDDLVEISDELYQQLLAGQSEGKVIASDKSGNPYLTDPKPKSSEEMISEANKEKERRLGEVNSKTQIWQTQLILGIINDEDKASLTSWMKYAQVLQKTDTSKAPNIDWPASP